MHKVEVNQKGQIWPDSSRSDLDTYHSPSDFFWSFIGRVYCEIWHMCFRCFFCGMQSLKCRDFFPHETLLPVKRLKGWIPTCFTDLSQTAADVFMTMHCAEGGNTVGFTALQRRLVICQVKIWRVLVQPETPHIRTWDFAMLNHLCCIDLWLF